MKPVRITFFGDSTCVGQGVSIYKGWVTRIAQYLDDYSKTIGREILVTNASVNGRTTRQALEDMPYHVQNHGVDILVVQFGLNDCNYWMTDRGLPRVSLPAFIANLSEILSRARRFGAFRVLLNNNHPTTRTASVMPETNITYEQSNQAYNQATRELAATLPSWVLFQDVEQHFSQHVTPDMPLEKLLLEDGLHLSPEGHTQYYELMYPVVRRALDDFLRDEARDE